MRVLKGAARANITNLTCYISDQDSCKCDLLGFMETAISYLWPWLAVYVCPTSKAYSFSAMQLPSNGKRLYLPCHSVLVVQDALVPVCVCGPLQRCRPVPNSPSGHREDVHTSKQQLRHDKATRQATEATFSPLLCLTVYTVEQALRVAL